MDHRGIQKPVSALVCALLLACIAAGPTTLPSVDPDANRQVKVDQLFTYLIGEYTRQLSSTDWMTRGVAVISLAQFPTDTATKAIMDRLSQETHPIGKLIVWQALLSRASMLTPEQFAAWQDATAKMMRARVFQGDLRVALLEMLASTPVSSESRKFVVDLFATTNSLDSADVPTLIAMGRTIRAWGDALLIDNLISAINVKDRAVRAKLVLKAAGATPSLEADAAEFESWWSGHKEDFTKTKPPALGWKLLKPQFIQPTVDMAGVDPEDKKWHNQLEVVAVSLRDFDFAITLDCSGSMTPTIERLKHDLLVMFSAFSQVAQQPRIAISTFSTEGLTRNFVTLTGNTDLLSTTVRQLNVYGGPGDEEYAGGIELTIKSNNWRPIHERSRRVIVMMTDEPITPPQYDKTAAVLKKAAKDGFRLYTVVVFPLENPPDPFAEPVLGRPTTQASIPTFKQAFLPDDELTPQFVEHAILQYEELAEITGGQTLIAEVTEGGLGLGRLQQFGGGRGRGRRRGGFFAPIPPNAIAPVYPNGGPTAALLTAVLSDAINPQYRQRVEPLVQILAAHSQHVSWVPEVRPNLQADVRR